MKVQKEFLLVRLLTGSHLYGTATAKSDFDFKVVCLPKLDDLLLNKKVTNRKEKPEGMKAGDKMVAGETETEYLPLQVFFEDFFKGQTYALEFAFAVKQGRHEMLVEGEAPEGMGETAAWHWAQAVMTDLVNRFTTSNVSKMVGYAVAQSKLYGLKTERFTSLKEVLRVVKQYEFEHAHELFSSQGRHTLKDCPELVERLVALPHVKRCELANARGGYEMAPGLDVCGKTFPLTNKVVTMVDSLTGTLENYGERVKEFEGEGVDWKALSHAMRITEQVLELSETGSFTFPRPNAAYLQSVKSGKVPLDEATDYLNSAFARVDEAVAKSVLKLRTPELEAEFEEWKLHNLRVLYGLPL